ncbi:hypothetical protein ACIG0C_33300 [Kitasatospora aureofaciens]|uniref:Peptidase inhibitor family I36 n=1 Tax=Kitasatospora aureofaciens TaxID=1894 RepID=A0A1E7NEE7_KITAU|nr:hypothetical protein [Kitasatospora aureofaciens]ARF83314.1 hypothetical protein B6264_30790 [Kitasatospora aureofaciens]OEV39081.1 hypothetical protein HS99_0018510 [Kitasatospora aureofaciens]GGV04583.1 hypothetical protein GCM10010502_69170 [Kitasatospora aureofaciens]
MSVLRSKIALLSATVGLAAGTVALATPASADVITGEGDQGLCTYRVCMSYYGSGNGAWFRSNYPEVTDLAGWQFGRGAFNNSYQWSGDGLPVKNAAAWIVNTGSQDIYVYVNSKAYGWGAYDLVYPGHGGNLQVTRNNEASYSTTPYS